jgi:hypothetical protein
MPGGASRIFLGTSPGSRLLAPISPDAFRDLVSSLDRLIEREVGALLNSSAMRTPKQIVGRVNDIQGLYASTDFFGQGGWRARCGCSFPGEESVTRELG